MAADEASYYISISELPNITSSGWNSFNDGIYVQSGDSAFSSSKQIVVSMDSANDWNLVLSPDKSASIGYIIATSSTDTQATTTFTFSAASIDAGVTQNLGAIVSDYSTKPMGTYQDTITFTVEVQTTATDLSTLTADYTATDGITLTGTLSDNVKIFISPDATVTLQDVTINGTNDDSYTWAGINCTGSATIILSGDNNVKGFQQNYPGIFISPDYTLTISGDGSLTASSNGYGAGDSGSCGTITIGGTVYPDGTTDTTYTYTNLAKITSDYIAANGTTLTGTLSGSIQPYKISIADNATVTLKDVTINGVDDSKYKWAGINCEGNVTIILSGDNTVKGFYEDYPGIHIAQNYTLTISGDGKLTASPFDGGGANIDCGNIVIAGGNITATGSNGAAGIGTGNNSSCGTITITDGVTKVTATKGNNATHCIGKGGSSTSCGTIIIMNVTYWTGSAYQGDDGENVLTADSYTYPSSN